VRNPAGRNQWSADRERRERFQAICQSLNRCNDEELKQQLIAQIAEEVVLGALGSDPRLLMWLVDWLLGTPEWWGDGGAHRRNWRRRRRASGTSQWSVPT
jgi:hypothetical protein